MSDYDAAQELNNLIAVKDAEIDRLTAQMREAEALKQAVQTILRGFDEGVFVRSIDGDQQSGWAIRLMPFVAALGKAQSIVSEPPPAREGSE